MANNYVKFLKGSPEAYQNCEKQNDTLYFIYTNGSTTGKLYLGDILISNGATEDGPIPGNIIDELAELLDVDVSLRQKGQVLGYDGDKWIPMTLPEAVSASVMRGATADTAGSAGLVPAPQAGDQNKFLRGDGTWAEVATTDADLSKYATVEVVNAIGTRVSVLETSQDTMQDNMTWGTL